MQRKILGKQVGRLKWLESSFRFFRQESSILAVVEGDREYIFLGKRKQKKRQLEDTVCRSIGMSK
jgi:hypothetical protein